MRAWTRFPPHLWHGVEFDLSIDHNIHLVADFSSVIATESATPSYW